MNAEEKFDETLWEIIQKIEEEISFQKGLKIVWKREKDSRDEYTYDKGEKGALARLRNLGAIEINEEPAPLVDENLAGHKEFYDPDYSKDRGKILYLTVLRPKFDEVHQELEGASQMVNKKILPPDKLFEKNFSRAIYWTLEEIKKESVATKEEKNLYFGITSSSNDNISEEDQRRAIIFLEKERIINIKNKKFLFNASPMAAEIYNLRPLGYFIDLLPKFNKTYREYGQKKSTIKTLPSTTPNTVTVSKKESSLSTSVNKEQEKEFNIPKKFKLRREDRKIFINDYIIGKPQYHARGYELLRYILEQAKKGNNKIKRCDLPDSFSDISLKKKIGNTSFTKLLNELGFKGEILKAFFPERSKNTVVYRGNIIHLKELREAGIKINVFLKELELANEKKSN